MKFTFLSLLLLSPTVVQAFQVEPMVQKLEQLGIRSQSEYRVENNTTQRLAIEVVVTRRDAKENAIEALSPADEDFFVLPPQATVEPGQFQSFRVRYVGKPENEAISYRIIFKQLPLKQSTEGSGVDLLFNLSTLVFVSPQNATPKIIAQIEGQDIYMTNRGNGVADMNSSVLTFKTELNSFVQPWSEVGKYSPVNYLLPNQKVKIPWQAEWVNSQKIVGADVKLQ